MTTRLRSGLNGALLTAVVIASIKDLVTDAPYWEVALIPLSTAIFCAAVSYVNKEEQS